MSMLYKTMIGMLTGLMSTYALALDESKFSAGETLFRSAGGYGCSTCHGMFAQGGGNVGGNIRGKGMEEINARLNNEPTMKLLADSLTTDDRKLLAFYLEALSQFQLIEWTIEDKPAEVTISIEAGKKSQLVIFNKRLEPVNLMLPSIKSGSLVLISPYASQVYEWTPKLGTVQLLHKQNALTILAK